MSEITFISNPIYLFISIILSIAFIIVFFYMAYNLSMIKKLLLRSMLKNDNMHRCGSCKVYYDADTRKCPMCNNSNPETWPIVSKRKS